MSTFRTFGTVAIMIACFAVIYPRFIHPIVLKVTGLNDPPAKYNAEDKYPPGHKGGRTPPRHAHDNMDEMKKNMRHSPQPGMRHAAEMNSRQQSQGSGRGMMGVVLPMYAVGIVCYLLYTLYKVFNKSKNPNAWDKKRGTQHGRPQQAASPQGRPPAQAQDRMGFPQDFAPQQEGDVREFLHDKRQRKDLEDLLTRVDDKNVSVDEMRLLQKRLEETEAQMSRILSAMQSVQSGVDTVVDQVKARRLKDEDSNEVAEKDTEEKEEKEDEENDSEEEKDNDYCEKPNKTEKRSESSEETSSEKEKVIDGNETSSQGENSPDDESKDEMIPEQTKDEEEDSSVRKRKVLCAED